MKKTFLLSAALAASLALTACGASGTQASESNDAASDSASEASATQTEESYAPRGSYAKASASVFGESTESAMEVTHPNYYFDFSDQISKAEAALKHEPDAADIKITASDEKGATGVVLVGEYGAEDSNVYYFNALVAGNKITLTAEEGATIESAESTNADSDIAVAEDGKTATFTPAPIVLGVRNEISDEVITVAMESGEEYQIHTVSEALPHLWMTGNGVDPDDAGVYSFGYSDMLIRVNSDRELVYYRNANCAGATGSLNFQVDTIDGVNSYAFAIDLNKELGVGGMNCGAFIIMDENYVDTDVVRMLPNDDPNHTHGAGYVDFHCIRVLGPGHYLTLSYTPLEIDNLPAGVEGINGTSKAFVYAGIFQEIMDGKVVNEINTTDYPELYDSAVEGINYAEKTSDSAAAASSAGNGEAKQVYCDYIHPNSVDYVLNDDGTVSKLLVSMRDQSAVYQFDMATGNIDWILGGKYSTLSGYDDYAETRADDNGVEFNALMFGQHYARYYQVNEDGTVQVSLFDNWTGTNPFMYQNKGENPGIGTNTRVMKLDIDPVAKTAVVNNCVEGHALDLINGKDHLGDHCGSVDYWSPTSTMIGWGLHMPVDFGMPVIAEYGLTKGDHPIFTDWNDASGTISLELCATASPLVEKQNAEKEKAGEQQEGIVLTGFAYRAYKNEH